MSYLFILLAFIAFVGFFINSQRKNGHGMAYSFTLFAAWVGLSYWFW